MSATASSDPATRVDLGIDSLRARTPLVFEPNAGQVHPDLHFLVRAGNFLLAVTGNEMVVSGGTGAFRFPLLGIRPESRWNGAAKLPGKVNYLVGRDQSKWARNVPTYSSIRRDNLYNGIDMVLRGDDHLLEYEFQVAPGADPSSIRIGTGGGQPSIDPNGDLRFGLRNSSLAHRKLRAYQVVNGKRRFVESAFDLSVPEEIRFRIGAYDRSLPLIIDPIVTFYTFIGGGAVETVNGMVAAPNNLYLTGTTLSLDFFLAGTPWFGANQGRNDGFVSKMFFNGGPVWSTYFGGSADDESNGIAVDGIGSAFLTGTTYSPNFPTGESAIQQNYQGNGDAFVIKMNIEGSGFIHSSYLGGTGYDYGQGVASDSIGYATFVGYTSSTDFPTRNARQPLFGGGEEDIFIYKLNANGALTEFSTYYGGAAADQAYAVTLDEQGNSYITGRTTCDGLGAGAIGPTSGTDVIVMKWRADGSNALYVTCVGGNGIDSGYAITVDSTGNAYVTGGTGSTNFPLLFPLQPNYGGAQNGSIGDAFLFKLNPQGTGLVFSTYVGGLRDDIGYSISLDSNGAIFLAGASFSPNLPSGNSLPPSGGNRFGYVLRLSATGNTVAQSFFFDSIYTTGKVLAAVNASHNVFVAGPALSTTNISTAQIPPLIAFRGSVEDIFLTRLGQSRLEVYADTYTPNVIPGNTYTLVQRVVNRGPDDATAVTFRGTLSAGAQLVNCSVPATFCSAQGSTFRIDVPFLFAGHGIEATLTVQVSSAVTQGSLLTITSTVNSDTYDPDVADNSVTTYLFPVGAGTVCNYAVTPPPLTLPSSASSATFAVSAPFSCSWAAYTPNDWITFATSNLATGTATVTVNFAPNRTAQSRVGSVTVAGTRYVVLQHAGSDTPFFTDVTPANPFYDYIQLLRAYGITTGCGVSVFCPDDITSRGQMAVFIIRSMLGGDNFPFPATPYFTDVPANNPQFKYIQKMRELGITSGCGPVTYCPDDRVTRNQMAVFLIRGRLAVSSGQTYPFPDNFSFNDVPPSYPTYDAIQKMKELGITAGCSAVTYCPDDSTSRAQMAVFLLRTFFTP